MSVDLLHRREVAIIAARTKWSRYEVVGRLLEFWVWVAAESADGRIDGLSVDDLASIHCFDRRFLDALLGVGWLIQDETGLVIPNFERWLSRSAKRRLQERERQSRLRHGRHGPCHAHVTVLSRDCCESVTHLSRSQRDKSVTTEEERREEKNNNPPLNKSPPQKCGGETLDWSRVVFPDGCDTPAVRDAILEWLAYRRKIGKRYRDPEKQISLLLREHGAAIVEAVRHSIAQGYQGCFLPQKGGHDARERTNWAAGPGQRHPDDATIASRGW